MSMGHTLFFRGQCPSPNAGHSTAQARTARQLMAHGLHCLGFHDNPKPTPKLSYLWGRRSPSSHDVTLNSYACMCRWASTALRSSGASAAARPGPCGWQSTGSAGADPSMGMQSHARKMQNAPCIPGARR